MKNHLAVTIVVPVLHKVVVAQIAVIVVSGPLQMAAEVDVKLPVMIVAMMAVTIQQNLHLAQIVAQIAVADVLRIAIMTAITLPNHPHALVVAIAVLVPVRRIAMIHVELDVTLRARDNAQVLE